MKVGDNTFNSNCRNKRSNKLQSLYVPTNWRTGLFAAPQTCTWKEGTHLILNFLRKNKNKKNEFFKAKTPSLAFLCENNLTSDQVMFWFYVQDQIRWCSDFVYGLLRKIESTVLFFRNEGPSSMWKCFVHVHHLAFLLDENYAIFKQFDWECIFLNLNISLTFRNLNLETIVYLKFEIFKWDNIIQSTFNQSSVLMLHVVKNNPPLPRVEFWVGRYPNRL
jgi:hypothetical protein